METLPEHEIGGDIGYLLDDHEAHHEHQEHIHKYCTTFLDDTLDQEVPNIFKAIKWMNHHKAQNKTNNETNRK